MTDQQAEALLVFLARRDAAIRRWSLILWYALRVAMIAGIAGWVPA
jgi:hypothetical protein